MNSSICDESNDLIEISDDELDGAMAEVITGLIIY